MWLRPTHRRKKSEQRTPSLSSRECLAPGGVQKTREPTSHPLLPDWRAARCHNEKLRLPVPLHLSGSSAPPLASAPFSCCNRRRLSHGAARDDRGQRRNICLHSGAVGAQSASGAQLEWMLPERFDMAAARLRESRGTRRSIAGAIYSLDPLRGTKRTRPFFAVMSGNPSWRFSILSCRATRRNARRAEAMNSSSPLPALCLLSFTAVQR